MFYEIFAEQILAGVMHWDWGRLSFLEIVVGENKDTQTYNGDDKR